MAQRRSGGLPHGRERFDVDRWGAPLGTGRRGNAYDYGMRAATSASTTGWTTPHAKGGRRRTCRSACKHQRPRIILGPLPSVYGRSYAA